jgi:LysR family glycine cleavage system transcriptional activator
MYRLPSLSGLRAFEAAARHLSFTRAAKELHVTQGAISHQIRSLEDDLGYALFHRLPRRVTLTEEGEILAQTITESFKEIDRVLSSLRQRQWRGWLTVSSSPSFAVKWLVPRLDTFRLRFPAFDVRIAATDRLVDPRRESVELCIRYGEGSYPGLDCEMLVTDQVFPVCSPRLLGQLSHPTDLLEQRLLHDEMFLEHPQRPSWAHWASLAQINLTDAPSARFSHASMALEAAAAGQGVALGRSSLVAADIAEGRLICPFGPHFTSPFSYWMVSSPGGLQRPRIRRLTDWIAETIRADTQKLAAALP